MKLVYGNGRVVRVWELGSEIMELKEGPAPLKCNGFHIMEDDAARKLLKDLLREGAKRV